MTSPNDILSFWYDDHGPADWFRVNPEFDATIINRFKTVHYQATQGELQPWRNTPEGRLAEVIILDQFSRNIHRGTPGMFASDELALSLAGEAIEAGADKTLTQDQRWMLYLPFMHSESADIHQTAMELFTELGLEQVLDYEVQHKAIIDRFGRYPHRNDILGRTSTDEEVAFLKEPGSSF